MEQIQLSKTYSLFNLYAAVALGTLDLAYRAGGVSGRCAEKEKEEEEMCQEHGCY